MNQAFASSSPIRDAKASRDDAGYPERCHKHRCKASSKQVSVQPTTTASTQQTGVPRAQCLMKTPPQTAGIPNATDSYNHKYRAGNGLHQQLGPANIFTVQNRNRTSS
jgi:hypothetical protein